MPSYLTLLVLGLMASASALPMEQGNFFGHSYTPWEQQQHPSSLSSEMFPVPYQSYNPNAGQPLQAHVPYIDPSQGGGAAPMVVPTPYHQAQQYPAPTLHHEAPKMIVIPPSSHSLAGYPRSHISTYYATGYPPESYDNDNYGHQRDLSDLFSAVTLAPADSAYPQLNPQHVETYVGYPDDQVEHPQDQDINSQQNYSQYHQSNAKPDGESGEEDEIGEEGSRNIHLDAKIKRFREACIIEGIDTTILTPQKLANAVLLVLVKSKLRRIRKVVVHEVIEPLLSPESVVIFQKRLETLWQKYSDLTSHRARMNYQIIDPEASRLADAGRAIQCLDRIDALAPLPPHLARNGPHPEWHFAVYNFLEFLHKDNIEISIIGGDSVTSKLKAFVGGATIRGFKTKTSLMEILTWYVKEIRPELPTRIFDHLIRFSRKLDFDNLPHPRIGESSSSAR